MMNLKPTAMFAGIWAVLLLLSVGFPPAILADEDKADTPTDDKKPDVEDNKNNTAPGGAGEGVKVLGPLLSCAHGLNGTVKALSKHAVELEIKGYDGLAKGAYFHAQLRNGSQKDFINAKEGAHTLKQEGKDCPGSRLSANKSLEGALFIVLDLAVPIAEYKTIGIFDYEGCQNLGHIVIDPAAVADLPDGKGKGETCPTPKVEPECAMEKFFPIGKCGKGDQVGRADNSSGGGTDAAGAPAVMASSSWSLGLGVLVTYALHHLSNKK